jgi:hypothetical protein
MPTCSVLERSSALEQVSVGLNRKDFQGFVNERV